MKDCVFCRIISGELPHEVVYEDDDILAFLDVSPVTLGHTLIITKEHFENFLLVPKDLLAKAFIVAQNVAQAQMTVLGAKGINILNNTNEVAGQKVMHFHIHVVPRYQTSEGFNITLEPKAIGKLHLPGLAEEMQIKLKSNF